MIMVQSARKRIEVLLPTLSVAAMFCRTVTVWYICKQTFLSMKKIFTTVIGMIMGMTAATAQPVSVILETDYGNDADDALVLDVMCKLNDINKLKLLGVSTHKEGAAICTAVDGSLNWFGYPKVPVARSSKPVSRPDDGNHYADSVALRRNSKGKPAFKPTRAGKYIDAVEFYRRTLAKQPDNSVVIVSVGFATNLALLLDSKPDKYSPLNGRELVARKVKLLSAMMGCYRQNPFSEYNINCDIPSMRKVMEEWPGDIVENPYEIGESVRYPVKLMRENLAWTTDNPTLVATSSCNTNPDYEQWEFDVMSVLCVLHPELFTFSVPGKISVDERGFNHFTPMPDGRHRYISVDSEQAKKLLELIIGLTSKKPKRYKKQ